MIRFARFALPALAVAFAFTVCSSFAGTVKGKVTDAEGKAVADAKVVLMPTKAKPKKDAEGAAIENGAVLAAEAVAEKKEKKVRRKRPEPVAQGTTNADGEYSLADVPAGKYRLMAMKRGVGAARTMVTVEEDGIVEADLTLKGRKPKKPKAD